MSLLKKASKILFPFSKREFVTVWKFRLILPACYGDVFSSGNSSYVASFCQIETQKKTSKYALYYTIIIYSTQPLEKVGPNLLRGLWRALPR